MSPRSATESAPPTAERIAAAVMIRPARRVWLGAHIDPDGDAVGSLLGLGLALEANGRSVTMACADPPPREVEFLPGIERIVTSLPDPDRHDLAIALDAGDAGRLGPLFDETVWSTLPSLVIDHHVSNRGYADVNLVDPESASTAEIVFDVLQTLGHRPDARSATCLLTGIITDTIGFRTPNTTPDTVETARQLMLCGADLARINHQVFFTRPLASLKLLGRALERMREVGPFAITTLGLEDFEEVGVSPAEARGISSVLSTAAEPMAVAVLRARSDGDVDVSLRSRPGVDLVPAAASLGGGGHPQAAGARVPGPLDRAADEVLDALHSHVDVPAARDPVPNREARDAGG